MALTDQAIGDKNAEPNTDSAPTLTIEEGDVVVVDTAGAEAGPASGIATPGGMRVKKRNGDLESVDVNKIVNAVASCSEGLRGVDPMRVATRTISALADGATTRELDELSIRTAAGLIVEEPGYSKLAARLLSTYIDKEVRNQNIPWFTESISRGHALGLIGDEVVAFANANAPTLNAAINSNRDRNFEFFGLRTVYDRYLLRHPETREVIETPQYFFLRVACGLSLTADEAVAFYDLMSSLAYLPSSPTLFNSGTTHPQMSSCYLLDSPDDSSRASTSATPTSLGSRSSPAASALPGTASAPRAASSKAPTGSRTASSLGSRPSTAPWPPSTRVAAARAQRASTSRPGMPTSTISSNSRTTPATTPGAPTTSTSPTGSRPVHAARRERLAMVAVRPKEGPPPHRPVRRSVRPGLRRSRRGRALRASGLGPQPLHPHDAHAGPNRQRLDDLQGRIATPSATRRGLRPRARHSMAAAVPRASCICRTCAPRSSRSPTRARPRSATSDRSTSVRS